MLSDQMVAKSLDKVFGAGGVEEGETQNFSVFRGKLPVPAVLFTASQFESRVVKMWKL